MTEHVMPAETARELLAALHAGGAGVCVGGGWGVDALLRTQTRAHADLDLWVAAIDLEALLLTCRDVGVDRVYPWPGDRPWNFVLHDGGSRRIDLHLYEPLGDGRLHYGSVVSPFTFSESDLCGEGEIDGLSVRCERPEFALANHTGYELRASDHHDIAVLCERFGLAAPD